MTLRQLIGGTLLAMALCACSNGADKDETGDRTPDPEVLLAKAADAAGLLETFHFRLEHENGSIELPLRLQLTTAEGDVGVPDRMKAQVRAKSGALNIDVDVINVNDRTWITNPFSRQVQELPGTNLRDIIDPLALMLVVTRELSDAKVVDSQKLDGVDTYHLTGTIDSAALDSVLPVEPGHSVEFEIWLGKEDSLPRRVRLKGALTASDKGDTVRRIDFSRFNEKVEIAAPR